MNVLQCNVCGFCAAAEIGVGCKSTKTPPCFGRMFIEPQLMDADWRCAPDSPEQDVFIDRCMADALHSLQSQLEQLRAVSEKWQRAAGHWKAQHEVAESRLAQVEQERDTAREAVTWITTEKQKVEQKLSGAIQLCKDKAAEWQLYSNSYNDQDGMSISLIGKAAAARELASEIGKL